MKNIKKFAILALFLFCVAALTGVMRSRAGEKEFSEQAWKERYSTEKAEDLYAPHQTDGVFFNPWLKMGDKGFLDVLGWKLSTRPKYTKEEETHLPRVLDRVKERIQSTEGDFILWIGHNTFLMRIGPQYWITDPIFSKRALLPPRVTPPAVTAKELAGVLDNLNILISHNHYDHLDAASIKALPENARVYVPMGLGRLLKKWNKQNVIEMNWWDETDCGDGVRLNCLPAQHWSLRIGQGRNSTLWASYLITRGDLSVYFGGDSGYFNGYREFGKKFPGIDYALMPTTAYHPRWFMHYQHFNIPEALQAFDELQARVFIPTQWGTFRLGDEPPGYPALDLKRHIQAEGRNPESFLIMDIGQIAPLKP